MYRYNPDDEIVTQLKLLLANTYSLYTQTQGAHWNVMGSDFPQLHTLFQTQYEELVLAIDLIAEHIRAYDAISPGSLQELLQLATTNEINFSQLAFGGNVDANHLIDALLENHTIVADTARKLGDITTHELHTNNLAADRLAAHKKAIWMLRSSMGRSQPKRRSLQRRNPWGAGDVKRHNKACASRAACRSKWPSIANAVLRDSHDKGKAIRIANWQTKRMGLYPRRNPYRW